MAKALKIKETLAYQISIERKYQKELEELAKKAEREGSVGNLIASGIMMLLSALNSGFYREFLQVGLAYLRMGLEETRPPSNARRKSRKSPTVRRVGASTASGRRRYLQARKPK
jgi:hypothetical protein